MSTAAPLHKKMKVVIFGMMVTGAHGHGAMNLPRPRNQGNQSVHPSPGQDRSCIGDACYWYHVGCNIGCETCSSEGKQLYPAPVCSSPSEPTNNNPQTRTWDPLGQSSHGDFTKYNPWRSPGKAPVIDPCGVASGYSHPSPYADIPAGYQAFAKGSEVLPETLPTYWKAGGTAEVGWALAAQHGGGYSYRLCPKGEPLTESCFQANHLSFTTKNSTVQYHDGRKADFQIPTTHLTVEGKQWRTNPIPACACDLGFACGRKFSDVVKEAHHSCLHSLLEGTVDLTPYAKHGPPTPACPHGTMFDAGWTPEGEGFLDGFATAFSIIDEVQVPNKPGDYVLGWRWDCEQTDQVWSNCADIRIANEVPPAPSPTPTPPSPPPSPPSPAPGKQTCSAQENPTCKGTFTNKESCQVRGCSTCAYGVDYDCVNCCSGCTKVSKGSIHYCSWVNASASTTDVFV
eukprot:gnl/MRDRNA2_/MRDRNA2_72440_c0_seq2.p1 gnl/MRDRNA2_/MRDRNA2_72440_c0~~gnl/MRDRNA2_/MRDRNA2_72440_c0_seq2.p1  ORF type:complete len:471 (-),score=58.66 gnl/MRDRNA2_/MRDRNA2_72440_c0_seq2:245-1612(-)